MPPAAASTCTASAGASAGTRRSSSACSPSPARCHALRERCAALLAGDGLSRGRVLACAARLLGLGFFRVGGESYAEDNDTFGLATMRKEHVLLRDGRVLFDYPSKGGRRRVQSLVDPEVHALLAALKRRRGGGAELLVDRAGDVWCDVTSRDVNAFIKDLCGPEASAKDFRTWHATALAAVALAVSGPAVSSATARKRATARAVAEVAHYLGNTPAVARASYIDPRVFDRDRSGWTIAGALESLGVDVAYGQPSIQGAVEEAVLDLLEYRRGSDALEHLRAG